MSVRKSLVISLSEKYVSILIQLAGSMIVARILTPAEFGIFSLAMSVSILAQVFRDLGVGQYLIQEKVLTEEKIRAAQTILITTSVILGSSLIFSAGFAGDFYSEPNVTPLLWMLGANLFLQPIGAIPFTLWRRNLQFGRLAIIGTVSTAVNTVTTVVLAYLGFSYLSLGWGVIAGSATNAILCLAMKPKGTIFLPGLCGLKNVLRYSSLATFNSLLESLSERAPSLVLAKTFGMEAVGYYERAIGVAEIFNRILMQAVWSISMPIFAEKIRKGQDVQADYLKAVSFVTVIGFAFMAGTAIAAEPIIFILFGTQWGTAVPIVQIICVGMAIGIPNYLSGSLLIGHGNLRLQTIVTVVSKGGAIIGAICGAFWGAEGVATGMAVSAILTNTWTLFCLRKYIPPLQILRRTFMSLIPAICLGISMMMTLSLFTEVTVLIWILSAFIGVVGWLLIVFVLKHPIVVEIKSIIKKRIIRVSK